MDQKRHFPIHSPSLQTSTKPSSESDRQHKGPSLPPPKMPKSRQIAKKSIDSQENSSESKNLSLNSEEITQLYRMKEPEKSNNLEKNCENYKKLNRRPTLVTTTSAT